MPEIGLFGSEGGAPTHGVPTLSARFPLLIGPQGIRSGLAIFSPPGDNFIPERTVHLRSSRSRYFQIESEPGTPFLLKGARV
jgi:hypothetical protein